MQSAPLPPGVDAETARKRMEAPMGVGRIRGQPGQDEIPLVKSWSCRKKTPF